MIINSKKQKYKFIGPQSHAEFSGRISSHIFCICIILSAYFWNFYLLLSFKCLVEALVDSEGSGACRASQKINHKLKKKLIRPSTTI